MGEAPFYHDSSKISAALAIGQGNRISVGKNRSLSLPLVGESGSWGMDSGSRLATANLPEV